VSVLQLLDKVGTEFLKGTGRVAKEMVLQANSTKFQISLKQPTIISIIPMLLSGIEYGDMYNLMNAQPVTFIVHPVFTQLEGLQAAGSLNQEALMSSSTSTSTENN